MDETTPNWLSPFQRASSFWLYSRNGDVAHSRVCQEGDGWRLPLRAMNRTRTQPIE